MMLRSFINGMIAAALILVPATPALSSSTPDTATNYDQIAKVLQEDPIAQQLPSLYQQFRDDLVDDMEDRLAGNDDPTGEFGVLGQELDILFSSMSGRDRDHGEFMLSLSKALGSSPVHTKLKGGEDVILDKVAVTKSYDLSDPADRASLHPVMAADASMLFESIEHTLITLTGNGNSRLVDAFVLYTKTDYADQMGDSIVIPMSSVDVDSDTLPPTAAGLSAYCIVFSFVTLASVYFFMAMVVLCIMSGGGFCWAAGGGLIAVIYAIDHWLSNCGVTAPPSYTPLREAVLHVDSLLP